MRMTIERQAVLDWSYYHSRQGKTYTLSSAAQVERARELEAAGYLTLTGNPDLSVDVLLTSVGTRVLLTGEENGHIADDYSVVPRPDGTFALNRLSDNDDLGWYPTFDDALQVAGDYLNELRDPPKPRAERAALLAEVPTADLQTALDKIAASHPDPDTMPPENRMIVRDVQDALAARTETSTGAGDDAELLPVAPAGQETTDPVRSAVPRGTSTAEITNGVQAHDYTTKMITYLNQVKSRIETQQGQLEQLSKDLAAELPITETAVGVLTDNGLTGAAAQFTLANAHLFLMRDEVSTSSTALTLMLGSIDSAITAYTAAQTVFAAQSGIAEQAQIQAATGNLATKTDFYSTDLATGALDQGSCGTSNPLPGPGRPVMAERPSTDHPRVPDEARHVDCPRCGTTMVPTEDVQTDESTGHALVVLVCGSTTCGRQGGWSWTLPESEYQAIFGYTLADGTEVDEEDDEPAEPEVITDCLECDQPLEQPTTDENKAIHPECDPSTPPQYWFGELTPNGKKIDRDQAEGHRRLKNLAEEVFDLVLESEVPLGTWFISFPDGSVVDAREWIERPEIQELAGGRDQFAGRGEYDPNAPDRCWIGQTLSSGRIFRPGARHYDDIAELAAYVCKEVERGKISADRAYTVMLPGGQLVAAHEWAHQAETRRLTGYGINRVRFRATGTCPSCERSLSTISTQRVEGKIGEQRRVAAAIYCDACDQHLPPFFLPVTVVDDASGEPGAPPRVIGDIE